MKNLYNSPHSFLLLCATTLSILFDSCSQERVVMRSHRRMPPWVNGLNSGYIVGLGTDTSLIEAQNKAMLNVKKKITESVSNRVEVTNRFNFTESAYADTSVLSTSFVNDIVSRAGDGYNLLGVTPALVKDYYYYVSRNKKTGTHKAFYALLYPFPAEELHKYINNWKNKQAEVCSDIELMAAKCGKHIYAEDALADFYRLIEINNSMLDCDYKYRAAFNAYTSYFASLNLKIVQKGNVLKVILENKNTALSFRTPPQFYSAYFTPKSIQQKNKCWYIYLNDTLPVFYNGNNALAQIILNLDSIIYETSIGLEPDISISFDTCLYILAAGDIAQATKSEDYLLKWGLFTEGLGGISIEKIVLMPSVYFDQTQRILSPLVISPKKPIIVAGGKQNIKIRLPPYADFFDLCVRKGQEVKLYGTLTYRENLSGLAINAAFSNVKVKSSIGLHTITNHN